MKAKLARTRAKQDKKQAVLTAAKQHAIDDYELRKSSSLKAGHEGLELVREGSGDDQLGELAQTASYDSNQEIDIYSR